MSPLLLLPAAAFGFLAGKILGVSRRGLSMLPPDRSSPIPGVPIAKWERFVAVMVVAPKSAKTPRGKVGMFGMDARRLGDVGFVDEPRKAAVGGEAGVWVGKWREPLSEEIFLKSTPAQYEAFSRSMRKMVQRAAPLVGRDVDGVAASLSGLLAAGHLAGEEGLAGWASDPAARKRFQATTKSFSRANGIF